MPKPNATVCGVPTHLGGRIMIGAAGPRPIAYRGPRDAVYAPISKPGAKRLAAALGVPMPRRGTQIQLCADQTLQHDASGGLYVMRDAPGDIRGARRGRRRGR